MRTRLVACVLVLAAGSVAATEPYAPDSVSSDDYDRAANLLSINLAGVVLNDRIVPHWISDDEFWYELDTKDGHEYVIVNAAANSRRAAFDHAALAEALSDAFGQDIDANNIGMVAYLPEADGPGAVIRTAMFGAQCDLQGYECTMLDLWKLDPFALTSPDGKSAVAVKEGNIFLRSMLDGDETQLTEDATADIGYAILPGSVPGKIAMMQLGADGPPMGAVWSPDSSRIVIPRVDETDVGNYPFVWLTPPDGDRRPRIVNKRIPIMGETGISTFRMLIFDVSTGARNEIALPEGCEGSFYGFAQQAMWSADGRYAFVLCFAADSSWWSLVRYDTESDETETVFREESETWIDLNHSLYQSMGSNVRIVDDGEAAIVFSQRNGWGHLYLERFGGDTVQITRGESVVHDILVVDEENNWVYYTAGGREEGRNPYAAHTYRTSLDGKTTELLTPEDAHHDVVQAAGLLGGVPTLSPGLDYFVDNYSTPQQPNKAVLRRIDGSAVTVLEEADVSALLERGYEPPESFVAKAADGETDLYGVIYKPKNMTPGVKYPIVEHIYGGPQTNITPRTYGRAAGLERIGGQGDSAVMTEAGFAVVMMDVRGTPWRSKHFHDYMWKKHHEFALEDHVAVIEQLGERYEWIDLDRVGVTGHSWGGFSSTLAMLRFPDFYKVAVSSAGPYDYRFLYPAFVRWTGWPEFADGSTISSDPTERPVNLTPHTAYADKLKGDLFIIYGEVDENTLPNSTLTLVDALIEADKDFDLLILPNRDHNFTNDPHFIRRRWDYFVEHLLDAEPPEGYSLVKGENQ